MRPSCCSSAALLADPVRRTSCCDLPTSTSPSTSFTSLIGEHIDYSAFPVLPTAVEADILIACAPRSTPSAANYDGKDEMVTIENMDERYEMAGFTPVKIGDKWELGVDRLKGGWANFVKVRHSIPLLVSRRFRLTSSLLPRAGWILWCLGRPHRREGSPCRLALHGLGA